MRYEKEGRKKQARSNKQQGKATQHTQGSHKKNELPRVGLEPTTLYTLDRAHVYVHILKVKNKIYSVTIIDCTTHFLSKRLHFAMNQFPDFLSYGISIPCEDDKRQSHLVRNINFFEIRTYNTYSRVLVWRSTN